VRKKDADNNGNRKQMCIWYHDTKYDKKEKKEERIMKRIKRLTYTSGNNGNYDAKNGRTKDHCEVVGPWDSNKEGKEEGKEETGKNNDKNDIHE
jgi:hypothetical protein